MRRHRSKIIFGAVLALAIAAHQLILHRDSSMEPPQWQATQYLPAGRQLQRDDLMRPARWPFRGSLAPRGDLVGRFLGAEKHTGQPVYFSDTLVLPPSNAAGLMVYELKDSPIRHVLEAGMWIRACAGQEHERPLCLEAVEVVAIHREATGNPTWAGLRVPLDEVEDWVAFIESSKGTLVVSAPRHEATPGTAHSRNVQ